MSLASLMVRPVTVLTASTRTDGFGQSTLDWSTTTSTGTTGWLAQTSSIENRDGREATVTDLKLVLPPGTVISALNRVSIDGRTYRVSSEPVSAWTPRGEHHIEVSLEVADG